MIAWPGAITSMRWTIFNAFDAGTSRDVQACFAQQPCQCNQRQSDQCRGIAGIDALEQTDAEAFALEAAGAIQRLFALDVAADFIRLQGAKMHTGEIEMGVALSAARVEHAQRRMK